jgi:hypothetical protein
MIELKNAVLTLNLRKNTKSRSRNRDGHYFTFLYGWTYSESKLEKAQIERSARVMHVIDGQMDDENPQSIRNVRDR